MAVQNYASSRVSIILQQHIKYQIKHSSVRSLCFKSLTLSPALYFTKVLSAPSCLNFNNFSSPTKILELEVEKSAACTTCSHFLQTLPFHNCVMTSVQWTAEFVNAKRMGHLISLHSAGKVQQQECKVGQRCQVVCP